MDVTDIGHISPDDLTNEKVLFLFNVRHGLAPYSHAFVPTMMDVQVLSGFVSAILSFMREALGSAEKSWRTEYGSDLSLIVEQGEWMVGVLAVSRVTIELRSKLRSIVKQFENDFEYMRDVDCIEGGAYEEFDKIVRQQFVGNRISDRSILIKTDSWVERSRMLGKPPSFEVVKLLTYCESGTPLDKISANSGLPLKKVIEAVSEAVWNQLASLIYVPSDNDILSLSEGASSILLKRNNPIDLSSDTVLVVSMMDGRTDLAHLLEIASPSDRNATLRELGILLNRGYIQREPYERVLLFMNECILSSLLSASSKFLGVQRTTSLLRTAMKQGCKRHPWIGRVSVDSDFNLRCRLDDTMSPMDLDDLRAALLFIQDRLQDELTEALGREKAEDLILKAQLKCHQEWESLIEPA
ncbi:MAG: hypothetical protein QXQ81_01275 [Candidatus Thorarchaeota archaeon]